jgi:hypothetical protein
MTTVKTLAPAGAAIQGNFKVTDEFTGRLATLARVALLDIEATLHTRLPELQRCAVLDLLGTAFNRCIAAVTPAKETGGLAYLESMQGRRSSDAGICTASILNMHSGD